jgi:acetyltransferase-like isoleucine patch superfamily enzyme
MKPLIKEIFLLALVQAAKALDVAERVTHIRSLFSLARQAMWKARLARVGVQTDIHRFVVIHTPRCVSIGSNCAIAEFVHIWGGGGVSIGDDVLVASHVAITSLSHDSRSKDRYRETLVSAPVVIGDNSWIGAGAIILPGVTIGRSSIVGAGAVVTKSVPPFSVVLGVPARERSDISGGPASDGLAGESIGRT